MKEDAVYFDSVTRELAEHIRLHGWGSWQIYPANGARGNVAVLGALYALFGKDPTLMVPINAAVVVRDMRYALVQPPFFVCNALLLKFAVATKHFVTIVAVALVGMLVNVVASLPSILVTMTAYGLLLLGYMVSLKDNGAGHFQAYPA